VAIRTIEVPKWLILHCYISIEQDKSSLEPWGNALQQAACTTCQWLTLVILTTQEVEIRRISVQANSLGDSILEKPITKKGWWSG
jgi:hypothetical protein